MKGAGVGWEEEEGALPWMAGLRAEGGWGACSAPQLFLTQLNSAQGLFSAQWFPDCGPWTGSISLIWEFVRKLTAPHTPPLAH